MFGIVDEYGVLEYGQVFIQYSLIRENKLERSKENDNNRCQILEGKVVVTKNPCHHPGDLRIFEAVNPPELRHLKDVIVFPQKGHRPHPNEISGSDLDGSFKNKLNLKKSFCFLGDEYVVIWHEDLIPKTPNERPYDYDSQGDPPKLDRPITREDINQVVMEVSEQDCLGSLSNIHLAYADKDGIKSEVCTNLAGHISQEVDAAKTGKHPLTEKQIIELRKGLDGKWPDFMKGRGKRDFYPSERVLGKYLVDLVNPDL
jgi:RNA-dependent RNA polymerase